MITSSDGDVIVDEDSYSGSSLTLTVFSPSTTYEVEITSTAYGCESSVFSSSFTTIEDCITPENIALSANPFEVTLSWDLLSAAESYTIVYKLPGEYWQSVTVTDTFLTLSHNGDGFAYFYVRSNCGDGFISPYSNVQIIDLPSCPTSIDIESDVVQFCAGGNATLSTSSDYASYQWYEGDGEAIEGATSSSYTANSSMLLCCYNNIIWM